jgi:hypothetical protein
MQRAAALACALLFLGWPVPAITYAQALNKLYRSPVDSQGAAMYNTADSLLIPAIQNWPAVPRHISGGGDTLFSDTIRT